MIRSGLTRIDGVDWRTSPQGVTRREVPRGEWLSVGQAELRTLPSRSSVWRWLAAYGVERPGRSGPSGSSTPEVDRSTSRVTLRLPPAELTRIDRLRADRGLDRSAYVVRLARVADGIDPDTDDRRAGAKEPR